MITQEAFTQLEKAIATGEWGQRLRAMEPFSSVRRVSFEDGNILFKYLSAVHGVEILEVYNCTELNMHFRTETGDVKTIVFTATRIRRDQMKKADAEADKLAGGDGFTRVPYQATMLKLVHRPSYDANRERIRLAEERAAEERKVREEAARLKREEEAAIRRQAHELAVTEFCGDVSQVIAEVGVESLVPNFDGGSFVLKLRDGRKVTFFAEPDVDAYDGPSGGQTLQFGNKYATVDGTGVGDMLAHELEHVG